MSNPRTYFGRPPIPAAQRKHLRQVMLTEAQAELARSLGEGNMSAGVRAALRLAAVSMAQQQRTSSPGQAPADLTGTTADGVKTSNTITDKDW